MQVPPLTGYPFQNTPVHPHGRKFGMGSVGPRAPVFHIHPAPPLSRVPTVPSIHTPVRLHRAPSSMHMHSESRVTVPVEPDSKDMVSLEYANQKLWNVTSEYEHLLTIQKDQQDLQLKQKDLEIQNLCSELGGKPPMERAYDKAMTTNLDAKVKELELYASLLQLRDKQIGELQFYIDQKDNMSSRFDDARSTHRDGEVEQLRQEKQKLERLVLAKDQEIQAITEINPNMSADGALQLGAKAVQLYYDSIDHRKTFEQQKEELAVERQENGRLVDIVRELESQLRTKRDEVSEVVQQVAAKTARVAELENLVVSIEQELEEARRQQQAQATMDAEAVDRLSTEHQTQVHIVAELKSELARRDQLLVERRAEEVANVSEAKIREGKLSEQQQHLESAEIALDKMLAHNNYKDQLVREMSEQINVSETKLHSYQVHELLRTRQRELEQKVRESELLEDMHEKERTLQHLNTELKVSQDRINVIRTNLDVDGESIGRPTNAPTPSTRHPGPRSQSWVKPTSMALDTGQGVFDRSFREQASTPPALDSAPVDDRVRSHQASLAVPDQVQDGFYQSIFGQAYQPYPNDPIDAWIARYVNDPPHRHLKALFCRLNKGVYLYGTHRANFQLAHTREGEMVEAFDGNGAWIPLPEFIRRMEPQASALYSDR